VEAILPQLTDDVDWAVDAADEAARWYGAGQGKDAVRGFFEGIARTGPANEFTPRSFAGSDDGDVHVFLPYAFTVGATGKDVR
jgi:hypothetical protein